MPLRTCLAATLALGLVGTAHAQEGMNHSAHQSMAAPAGDTDSASTNGFKEADAAMMQKMQVDYTGDADIDFRIHMIPHHEGAIAMAKVALEHAKSADTKAVAQKIIDDQEKEIAEMKAWLKKHGH